MNVNGTVSHLAVILRCCDLSVLRCVLPFSDLTPNDENRDKLPLKKGSAFLVYLSTNLAFTFYLTNMNRGDGVILLT